MILTGIFKFDEVVWKCNSCIMGNGYPVCFIEYFDI